MPTTLPADPVRRARRQRNINLTITFRPEHHAAILAAASTAGCSTASVIRRALVAAGVLPAADSEEVAS